MTIVYVWGMGKAGLPLAMVIADSGQRVIGVDVSKERVAELNKGVNPFPEERGLDKLLKKHIGNNFRAMTSEEYAEMVEKEKALKSTQAKS